MSLSTHVSAPPSVRTVSVATGRRRSSPMSSLLCRFRRSRTISPTPPFTVMPARLDGRTRQPPPVIPNLSFCQAFGMLGILLLVVTSICIVWTSWLIFLTVAPNNAANLLMNTGDYDNGNFWLIIERPNFVKWSSTAGLLVVDACYAAVVVKILTFRRTLARNDNGNSKHGWAVRMCGTLACSLKVKCRWQRILTIYGELTGYNGKYRKFFGLVLRGAIQQGLPDVLVLGYASFVCVNSLSACFNILTRRNSAFAEVLIDSIFDLIAAVIYPIIVLVYCYYNFTFDRAVYLVNAEVLPEGNFERLARTQADPAEVALFLMNFDSLRIGTLMEFILTIGLNLSFCYRVSRVTKLILVENNKLQIKRRRSSQIGLDVKILRPWQKTVPRWGAIPFVAASVFVIIFTYSVVSNSRVACAAYPRCVAFSYVWNTGDECPCIMLIDSDRAPRTVEEWNFPQDVTEEVRTLAKAGWLQELQLINRQLLHWPDELRRCTNLRTISLYYTSTEEIPSWTKEFKQLQYLHLEGKYGSQNLVTLPSDLFEDLPELTFLHFGNHHDLVAIPAFNGIPKLRSITFAVLLSLKALPSFEQIPLLEALTLAHIPQVVAIPDMSPLTKLSRFAVFRPNHLCCDGFLGACDPEDSYCQYEPVFNIPAATCLPPNSPLIATKTTLQIFKQFSAAICQKSAAPFAIEALSDMPSPERIASCAGIPYRKCEIPGVTSVNGTEGMCYSSRMQVIACNVDPLFIKVRRIEIERGVGPPCDPHEESWLGCK